MHQRLVQIKHLHAHSTGTSDKTEAKVEQGWSACIRHAHSHKAHTREARGSTGLKHDTTAGPSAHKQEVQRMKESLGQYRDAKHGTIVRLSFHHKTKEHVHALKGLACRKRVAAASSPATTCKQGAALTSPARHACGCARPSRARFGHRSGKTNSDGSKT